MGKENMTHMEVAGFDYTLSIAAKTHIEEILAPYDSMKVKIEQPTPPAPPKEQPPLKPGSSIFGEKPKKDKKKK